MSVENNLSNKERDVADCLTRGMTNLQIAQACDITENTVKTHLKSIFKKLGVENRTQAVLTLLNPS
ncbi:MAG: LuxR family transcriptional regulator [Cryomorphaceae bacterium]|nr:MAG: LuxR family transcriptional regulator [Cryomorphaceae bacterium]